MEESVLIVVAIVLWLIFLLRKQPLKLRPTYYINRYKNRGTRPSPRALQPRYQRELQAHFIYYQNLDPKNKKRFEARVQAFIDSKEFIPRSYTHVNDEMKALIAGAAIQLTFGFQHLNFDHFSHILIYQDDYYSKISRQYHQGEVNTRGLIVLSWRNFVQGYQVHNDGRNLGLHEMAHALRLENAIYNDEYDFMNRTDLEKFDRLAHYEIGKIRGEQSSFFRSYAAENKHEFFAVAVEHFFEQPLAFKAYNQHLYYALAGLLKQDPLRLFKGYNSIPY